MARISSKIHFILLPLLCVVWQGIVYSEAQGTYDVPIVNVPTNPLEALYQYPMEGNGFKANDTHVFWPANQKLFSKFYINVAHEGEKLFGISQQIFEETPEESALLGATMGANDHLAFVKVEGPWNDGTVENSEDSDGYSPVDTMDLEDRLMIQRKKLQLYLQWSQLANVTGLLSTTATNPAQIPALLQMPYNSEAEKKILAEMDEFSAGLSQSDYRQFDKSALMCFHINPVGAEVTTEEDDTKGWWLPLKHNLLAWRSMSFQQPLSALRFTMGLFSLNIDESGNLNAMLQAPQFWKTDVDVVDYKNMELQIAPPNAITHHLPDMRPQPPARPMEPLATMIREGLKALPNDNNLPWMPRDDLCSEEESRFNEISRACYPFTPSMECAAAFINFYPCLNIYLRPSKKHNHGMDSFTEIIPVIHLFSESPPSFWKQMAIDKPWEEEFEQAVDNLGLGI